MTNPAYEWRGSFEDPELNRLHAECFGHPLMAIDWWHQVNRFSLGWVCMRSVGALAGFVNVAWDGGVHACMSTSSPPRTRFTSAPAVCAGRTQASSRCASAS